MDYLHGYRKKIASEAHLEKVILRKWDDIFDFDHYATRLKISSKSIVDLIGKDESSFWLIELKFRPVRKKDVAQVKRYETDFRKNALSKHFKIKKIIIDYDHMTNKVSVYALSKSEVGH